MVLAGGAEGHDSGDSNVDGFLLIFKAVKFSFLIWFVSILIVYFKSDMSGFGAVGEIDNFKDSSVVPRTKRILTVYKISRL